MSWLTQWFRRGATEKELLELAASALGARLPEVELLLHELGELADLPETVPPTEFGKLLTVARKVGLFCRTLEADLKGVQ